MLTRIGTVVISYLLLFLCIVMVRLMYVGVWHSTLPLHIVNTQIFGIFVKHSIIWYCRYVDHFLLVYQNSPTNIHEALTISSNLTPAMHFTMEEVVNKTNFQDSTISKDDNKIILNIYRKSIRTDIIPNDSCHPTEDKLTAVGYLT